MSELVLTSRDARIGVVTVNNPPVNALSPGVPEGIAQAIAEFETDPGVDAIVLIGGGRTFIAGADIREFGKIDLFGDRARGPGLVSILDRIEDSSEARRRRHPRNGFRRRTRNRHGLPLSRRRRLGAGGPARSEARHHSRRRRHATPARAWPASPKRSRCAPRRADQRSRRPRPRHRRRDRRRRPARRGHRFRPFHRSEAAPAHARLPKNWQPPPPTPPFSPPPATPPARSQRNLPRRSPPSTPWKPPPPSPSRRVSRREAELFHECLFSDQSKALIHAFFGERTVAKIPDIPRKTTPRRSPNQSGPPSSALAPWAAASP